MEWIQLFRDLGVFTAAGIILKGIINYSTKKNIESYKKDLEITLRAYQLTLDSDLERHKASLNLQTTKQKDLHTRRLKIIDKMYKKLVLLDSGMRNMTGMHLVYEDGVKEQQVRVETAQNAITEYNNYVIFNKLYFDVKTAALLEEIRKAYWAAYVDFFEPKRLEAFTGGRSTEDGYREALNNARAATDRIHKEIPKTLELLEQEFQKLLGVTS